MSHHDHLGVVLWLGSPGPILDDTRYPDVYFIPFFGSLKSLNFPFLLRRCRINLNSALMALCLVIVAWGQSTAVKLLGESWRSGRNGETGLGAVAKNLGVDQGFTWFHQPHGWNIP